MKIHEYQARNLFAAYGIAVDKAILCRTANEAAEAYRALGADRVVVKAQVHTGGRGKAGGVKLAKDEAETMQHAAAILGMTIKDFTVDRVLITPAVNIAAEYYLSITIDRNSKTPLLMISREGGVDIEEVANKEPEKIYKIQIDPSIGLPDYLAREAAFKLFDEIGLVRQCGELMQKLYRLFKESDASLAEINPLVLTKEGEIKAIDAKMSFDDNALYRHPELKALAEYNEEEQIEQEAKGKGISYVALDGEIGCMVNGAGLAMATMDMIKLYGGNPANFLDIGGSSNPQKVVEAMKLLLASPRIKAVLINIFGGITRCDDVARGLIEAFEEIKTELPIVIRLTGTNEQEGRVLLANTRFHLAETMNEAGRLAVKLAKL